MKLHLTRPEGNNLITGYGPGWVQINETRHSASLILMPGRILPSWPVADFEALAAEHFTAAIALAPEILLLGTGAKLRFPPAACLKLLIEANVGYEIMDTAAACRTYNILMSEGRNVAAALII
ncbi:MAG TPA: Mth938-like domain-containing protein [Novimethylophilus sp.]|jgi:uncharacterized protein|uniref:Mth938-like domain-containing protein n=1 Tax=Novimethylophilus sp. TaxID=2137426 RepID=UPI002F425B2E